MNGDTGILSDLLHTERGVWLPSRNHILIHTLYCPEGNLARMASKSDVSRLLNTDMVARVGLLLVLIAWYLPAEMSDTTLDTLGGLLMAYMFVVAGAIGVDLLRFTGFLKETE